MISTQGREEVGGVWAVSTHPQHAGRGVASRLLDEAHARMRDVGLRFSTLGTNRFRGAYKLYQRHGYVDRSAFMVKPLVPEVTVEEAQRLFGIGADRFLISWLDVT